MAGKTKKNDVVCTNSPPVLIIDNGSTSIKVGFSGYEAPHALLPSLIGVPRRPSLAVAEMAETDRYVGDEAQARRKLLRLRWQIMRGVVTDFDDLLSVSQIELDVISACLCVRLLDL